MLPAAVDPTKLGYGQPGAGSDLITDTGLVKLKHAFNDNWSIEIGGLYQNADRNLLGITNTLTDNAGDYTVTKNFNAVDRFTVGSNMAYLHGHFDTFGMKNDFTFGTNGFVNGQYLIPQFHRHHAGHLQSCQSHGVAGTANPEQRRRV